MVNWRTGALMLLVCLLVGCKGEQETEQPPLPPLELETQGSLTMDADTAAVIRLPGIPPEMMVDDAGQIVVASGLENVGGRDFCAAGGRRRGGTVATSRP